MKSSENKVYEVLDHDYYGEVCVTSGAHKGRIGYVDDYDGLDSIVYFGQPLNFLGHHVINRKKLRLPTTDDLLKRKNLVYQTRRKLYLERIQIQKDPEDFVTAINNSKLLERELELLHEENYIGDVLRNRILKRDQVALGNKKIFISHSSEDKYFVRRVVDDLKLRGHCLWFDETAIKAGDCIPSAIQSGLDESSHVLVFLSKKSVSSGWVKVEWISKFWEEVYRSQIIVIPLLIEDCDIPTLLKTKKYADFTESYNDALNEVIQALN